MNPQLDPVTHERVSVLCQNGDAFAAKGEYDAALREYSVAWSLVPQPKDQWAASTWILAAIGDALFHRRDFADAFEAFTASLDCPGAIGNPFIHLRIGQSAFELGEQARALDELTRAYMGGGRNLFY